MESSALDLVNSEDWYGRGPDRVEDHLADTRWLDAFLAKWGFGVAPPSPSESRALGELRALLRRIVMAVAAGRAIPKRDLAQLDGVLGEAQVRRRIASRPGGLELQLAPQHEDWRWVRSEIAASLAELLAYGELERLKVCANAECRWAFYDESKNRRRRWCGAASCGDLDKVRRFRERQRAAAATGARPATPRSPRSRR